jgi:hypothetical protein
MTICEVARGRKFINRRFIQGFDVSKAGLPPSSPFYGKLRKKPNSRILENGSLRRMRGIDRGYAAFDLLEYVLTFDTGLLLESRLYRGCDNYANCY